MRNHTALPGTASTQLRTALHDITERTHLMTWALHLISHDKTLDTPKFCAGYHAVGGESFCSVCDIYWKASAAYSIHKTQEITRSGGVGARRLSIVLSSNRVVFPSLSFNHVAFQPWCLPTMLSSNRVVFQSYCISTMLSFNCDVVQPCCNQAIFRPPRDVEYAMPLLCSNRARHKRCNSCKTIKRPHQNTNKTKKTELDSERPFIPPSGSAKLYS